MSSFSWNDNTYYYDENAWEEVAVPSGLFEGDYCLTSLHYTGKVTDGCITEEIPDIPTMYRMFADIQELVEPPVPKRFNNAFELFTGCHKLNPCIETVVKLAACEGTVVGQLFDGCKSPCLFNFCNEESSEIVGDAESCYVEETYKVEEDIAEAIEVEIGKKLVEEPMEEPGISFRDEIEETNAGNDEKIVMTNIPESAGKDNELPRERPKCIRRSWKLDPDKVLEAVLNTSQWEHGNTTLEQFAHQLKKYSDYAEEKTIIGYDCEVIELRRIESTSECLGLILAVDKGVVVSTEHQGSAENPFRRGLVQIGITRKGFKIEREDPALSDAMDIELSSCDAGKPVQLGENGTLYNRGTSSITAECPVEGSGTITIKGSGDLVLTSLGLQPCIGPRTATGFSYGRWEPSELELKKIVIDGVNVICKGSVPNFALGSYGRQQVPDIEIINGGNISCPEKSGERVMVKNGGEGLSVSTKRVKPAVYRIEMAKNQTEAVSAFSSHV
jgi:hypothetical protein